MIPTRRRQNKKRRVRQESSVDEDGMDVDEGQKAEEKSPAKRVLQPIDQEDSNLNMSEEKTAATPFKPPHAAAQGKKWVKVKKTE